VSETICALDVGTTKVCALIGRLDDNNSLRVIGAGRVPSKGLRRGVVVNTVDATATIGQAIEAAEAAAGATFDAAYVGISGAHIGAIQSKGVAALGRNGRKVTADDCQRAVDQARNIALPHNRDIINAVPRSYTVDDLQGVRNPVGMFAYRLEVDASLITGATSAITNLTNCVHDNGVEIQDLVLEPLASAEAVLTNDERQAGVAVVDIGGGTTDMAIFLESSPWHTHVVDVGGDHFVRDVAAGLRMPYEKAEALIKQFGNALPARVPPDAEVRSPAFGEGGYQVIQQRSLADIIYFRAEEVMDLIVDEIMRSGYDGLLPAGVVLTGGVAQLTGFGEMAHDRLRWPVRIGRPNGIGGAVVDLSSPEYATAVGLLLWGLRRDGQPRIATSAGSSGPSTVRRILDYLKRFLPIPTP
jgi:cell division protein FtsA